MNPKPGLLSMTSLGSSSRCQIFQTHCLSRSNAMNLKVKVKTMTSSLSINAIAIINPTVPCYVIPCHDIGNFDFVK